MKRYLKYTRRTGGPLPQVGDVDRRGSVLLVVIGLLGMLLLVGIAFYSFAAQEVTSSQYYAEGAKEDDSGLSPEKLFSFALEQLIVGTSDVNRQQSALWGRRHALLTGILGRTGGTSYEGFDLTPFNGQGINLGYSTAMGSVGDPYVDQDYDGTDDGTPASLNLNFSAAGVGTISPAVPTIPAPDVDYTAADINSIPLSFVGRGVDSTGADVNVIIPSFHRPQLLRSGGAPIVDWQTVAGTRQRVLRPHPEHDCVFFNTTTNAWEVSTTYKRFLSAASTNALGQTVNAFPFGSSATVQQGVWDLTGPPAGALNYAWDVDNDGDGISEGIWMDLDFPMQVLADGRRYVPLFSFTVTDADGLINLNVSGNQSGLTFPIAGLPLAGGRHISRSNQGLSRAEISPQWALYADPTTDSAVPTQHNIFWNTSAAISRLEMSNIEALFMNMGRPEFTTNSTGTYSEPAAAAVTYEPTKYYPGRYGELELMAPYSDPGRGIATTGIAAYGGGGSRDLSFLPQAGRANVLFATAGNPYAGDDDVDALYGQSHMDVAGYFFMGASFAQLQSGTAVPSFIHPLDYFGEGIGYTAGANGVQVPLSTSGLTTPMQWPLYSYGYSTPGVDTTGSGFINYLNAGAGSALLPTTHPSQTDEADEIIAEWELATSNSTMEQDQILGPDNMLELQATDSDLATATLQARIRNLAPYNFTQAAAAEAIRHQFTVLSHDRKTFGMAPFYRRSWEFNADSDSDSNFEFPPASVTVAGTSAAEPFRQVLRQLLYVEQNQSTALTTLTQLRLNLNRVLASIDTTNGPTSYPYGAAGIIGAPVYRELTAHPVGLGNAPITYPPTWNADSPSGSPSANDQEYWARVDRQRMARDIYVLLYILGGGRDDVNYATTSNAGYVLYTAAQLKEMAQFAVNVVDELDRDEVITKFEYDTNLADGWNLNDYPYNSLTDTENAVTDREIVFGVEAQKLTFSELLGIISRRVSGGGGTYVDHVATQVNDSEGMSDRYHTFIELRNASPFSVDLGGGEWQIAVIDEIDPDMIPNNGDEYEQDRVELTLISGTSSSIIAPGALFTIGTRGGPAAVDPMIPTDNLPSIFKVDSTGSPTPDFTVSTTWIAPASGTLDLDLIPPTASSTNNTAQFRLTDASATAVASTDYTTPGTGLDVTTAGNFLYGGTGGNVSAAQETVPTKFVLRRRAHPTRTMPVSYSSNAANHNDQSLDNPWVEVDRMDMPAWRVFSLLMSDTSTDVQTKLEPLTSWERGQPFSRSLAEAAHAPDTTTYRSNSVAAVNSNSPATFSQIQLHFDRDFASPVDLFSVPLYGPDQVTRRVGYPAVFNDSATTSLLAQERFLRPHSYANLSAGISAATIPSAATAATDTLNNRWYRLLEFIEVPNQTEQGLRVYPYAMRNSGAVNLNMARHRGVLAGVIDDPDNPTTGATLEGHHSPAYASEATMLVDQYESSGVTARDWWLQFLGSRDGVDPLTGLILPGTPAGRPFRSLSYSERSSTSLEDTVLRSLPVDVGLAATYDQYADRRGLFEARASADRPSSGGGDLVDAQTRHRLLRKVYNNTTTRSNVFVVWISTRFFEAIEQPTGEVQIGDVLEGAPDHRGFFIVDRSLPEAAYNGNSGRFDFRKFVQYRKTLQ